MHYYHLLLLLAKTKYGCFESTTWPVSYYTSYRKLRLLGASTCYSSGKKYELNNVYTLNKQVSKYMVMAFFSQVRSYTFICTYWLWICTTMHVLYTFSIARLFIFRIIKTWCPELYWRVTYQVEMLSSCKNCALLLWHSFHLISITELHSFFKPLGSAIVTIKLLLSQYTNFPS